jgi:hypothetical protein
MLTLLVVATYTACNLCLHYYINLLTLLCIFVTPTAEAVFFPIPCTPYPLKKGVWGMGKGKNNEQVFFAMFLLNAQRVHV